MTGKQQSDRIMTMHPNGKNGVNITTDKYDCMRKALLKVIPRTQDGVAFQQLTNLVRGYLDKKVFGPEVSIKWYVVTVKQDLEARGLITQVPGKKTQHLRRVSGGKR